EHEAWSCTSRLQSPRTPALILSASPEARNLDVGFCALACTVPYAPITTEGRGAKIQELDFCHTWGNDRHTLALLPSCLAVLGATDEVMTAIEAALPKGVVVAVKCSLPFDRPCPRYKQPSLHSPPFSSGRKCVMVRVRNSGSQPSGGACMT